MASVHAVGPGHGKAIISSYVVAKEETGRPRHPVSSGQPPRENIPGLQAFTGKAKVRRWCSWPISATGESRFATDGFDQSELMVPKQRLEEAGAMVDIISLKTGEIWGWDHDDWGEPIEVDRTIDAVSIDEYDALVIPGGVINPDLLRQDEDAVALVRDFYASKKPLAAICHAPWVLIEAGIAKGRTDDLVSFHGN